MSTRFIEIQTKKLVLMKKPLLAKVQKMDETIKKTIAEYKVQRESITSQLEAIDSLIKKFEEGIEQTSEETIEPQEETIETPVEEQIEEQDAPLEEITEAGDIDMTVVTEDVWNAASTKNTY
jgi:chromosome segregation ATPase